MKRAYDSSFMHKFALAIIIHESNHPKSSDVFEYQITAMNNTAENWFMDLDFEDAKQNSKIFFSNISKDLPSIDSMIEYIEHHRKPFQQIIYLHALQNWVVVHVEKIDSNRLLTTFIQSDEAVYSALSVTNFIESQSVICLIADSQGTIIYINSFWEKILGYSYKESLGKPIDSFIPFFKNRINNEQNQSDPKKLYEDQVQVSLKDGKRVDLLVISQFTPTHILMSANDITEYKQSLSNIENCRKNMELILNNMHECLVLLKIEDDQYYIQTANQQFLNKLNLHQQDLTNQSFLLLLPTESRALYQKMLKKCVETQEVITFEESIESMEDTNFYSSTLNPIVNNHQIESIIISSRIITRRKTAESALLDSQNVLNSIIRAASIGTWQWDYQQRFFLVNEFFNQILGYPLQKNKWHLDEFIALIHPDDFVSIKEIVKVIILKKSEFYQYEFRIQHHDGNWIWAKMRGNVSEWENEVRPRFTTGVLWDITDRKFTEIQLVKKEEEYRSLTENMVDVLWERDFDLTLKYVSPSIEQLTGYSVEEYMSMALENQFSKEVIDELRKTVQEELDAEQYVFSNKSRLRILEIQYTTKYQESIWVELRLNLQRDENGRATSIQGISRDITTQKQALEQINFLNFHDPLTTCYNLRFYQEESKRLDTLRNYPLSLIIADVDGLKLANDAFGHQMGNSILIKIANVLRKTCRSDDIIARIGGDEFAVLLPKADIGATENLIKRIHEALKASNSFSIPLSLSIGYASKDSKSIDFEEVFKKAEDMMYRQKLLSNSQVRLNMLKVIEENFFRRFPDEYQHACRVSAYCEKMARLLKFNEAEIETMRLAGYYHDIGKVSLNEESLLTQNQLTEVDWIEIKRHCEVGYRILSSVNNYSNLAQYVLDHHERIDGLGYPKQLKEDQISIGAKIIMIANAYDSMSIDKKFKKAMDKKSIVQELRRCAGTQFDQQLVEQFIHEVIERYQ